MSDELFGAIDSPGLNSRILVAGLLCLKTAKEGGHSQWACSASIHNEMLEKTPELYQELCSPLWVDRKNEVPPGKLPYYQMPVFNFHQASNPILTDTDE